MHEQKHPSSKDESWVSRKTEILSINNNLSHLSEAV